MPTSCPALYSFFSHCTVSEGKPCAGGQGCGSRSFEEGSEHIDPQSEAPCPALAQHSWRVLPGQIDLQLHFSPFQKRGHFCRHTHSCPPASCVLLLMPRLPCPSSRAGHAEWLAGYLANRRAVLAPGPHTSYGSSGQAGRTVTASGHIGLGLGGVFLGSHVVFGPFTKGFGDFCVAL